MSHGDSLSAHLLHLAKAKCVALDCQLLTWLLINFSLHVVKNAILMLGCPSNAESKQQLTCSGVALKTSCLQVFSLDVNLLQHSGS